MLLPRSSVWFGPDGTERSGRAAPFGGFPVTGRLRLSEEPTDADELRRRTAALEAWVETHAPGGGFLVGDGLDAGRAASASDLAPLDGPDVDGVPRGLARCPVCGDHAGEMLDRRELEERARPGEPAARPKRVLRVHCRCDNWNRCVRCGERLAQRRLSARYWDEAAGSAWYVPAFSALGHTCPDEAVDTDQAGGSARPPTS